MPLVLFCYVMFCYVILFYVMLCYVMLCYVMLCYVMLCYVMLCYVMLCYVMLCYVMLCYVMLCYLHAHVARVCFMDMIIFISSFRNDSTCNVYTLYSITTCCIYDTQHKVQSFLLKYVKDVYERQIYF